MRQLKNIACRDLFCCGGLLTLEIRKNYAEMLLSLEVWWVGVLQDRWPGWQGWSLFNGKCYIFYTLLWPTLDIPSLKLGLGRLILVAPSGPVKTMRSYMNTMILAWRLEALGSWTWIWMETYCIVSFVYPIHECFMTMSFDHAAIHYGFPKQISFWQMDLTCLQYL